MAGAFRDEVINAMQPDGRMSEMGETSAATAYLLSTDSKYINGASLAVASCCHVSLLRLVGISSVLVAVFPALFGAFNREDIGRITPAADECCCVGSLPAAGAPLLTHAICPPFGFVDVLPPRSHTPILFPLHRVTSSQTKLIGLSLPVGAGIENNLIQPAIFNTGLGKAFAAMGAAAATAEAAAKEEL
jgi:hypothetical protein